jgi:hypothetical protein
VTFDILAVSRLLTDDEQGSPVAAFAENRLRAGAPQRAGAADRRSRAQLRQ